MTCSNISPYEMGVGKLPQIHGISPEVKGQASLQLNSSKHCKASTQGKSEIDFIPSWILFNLSPNELSAAQSAVGETKLLS